MRDRALCVGCACRGLSTATSPRALSPSSVPTPPVSTYSYVCHQRVVNVGGIGEEIDGKSFGAIFTLGLNVYDVQSIFWTPFPSASKGTDSSDPGWASASDSLPLTRRRVRR